MEAGWKEGKREKWIEIRMDERKEGSKANRMEAGWKGSRKNGQNKDGKKERKTDNETACKMEKGRTKGSSVKENINLPKYRNKMELHSLTVSGDGER
jgi:hypothetical protein